MLEVASALKHNVLVLRRHLELKDKTVNFLKRYAFLWSWMKMKWNVFILISLSVYSNVALQLSDPVVCKLRLLSYCLGYCYRYHLRPFFRMHSCQSYWLQLLKFLFVRVKLHRALVIVKHAAYGKVKCGILKCVRWSVSVARANMGRWFWDRWDSTRHSISLNARPLKHQFDADNRRTVGQCKHGTDRLL